MVLSASRSTAKQVGDPIPPRIGRGMAVDIGYKGGMAAINAAGYLAPAGIANTDIVVGRFVDTYDNSGGSAGDINGEAEQGIFRWANGDSITVAHIGDPCYASDDQTVNKSDAAGRPYAGRIVDVDSQGVWVLQGLFMQSGAAPDAEATLPQARYVMTTDVPDLGAFTVAQDGVTGVAGDFVLLANQTTASQNGVYTIGTVAAGVAPLTRAAWMPAGTVLRSGYTVHVESGTLFASTDWFISTAGAITIGTTAHAWYPEAVTQSVALVAGTVTLSNVPILSATKTGFGIVRNTANTSTLTVGGYHPTVNGVGAITPGVVGTGSVTFEACVGDGTINNADISTLSITIINR